MLRTIARCTAIVVAVAPMFANTDQQSGARPSRSTVAFTGALPKMDGDRLDVRLVDVTYEPGGANGAHRHPCPVVGYVLEGALRMQIEGKPEAIYKAGDTFYESPADVHVVSANASNDRPARFLAYFVCAGAPPQLSIHVSKPAGMEQR